MVKTKDIEVPVLIYGEKGVGKSLFARIIHHEGKRGLRSYVTIDCSITDDKELENGYVVQRKRYQIRSMPGRKFIF